MYLSGLDPHIVRLIGIARQPNTEKLVMLMTWCSRGDLRGQLKKITSYTDVFMLIEEMTLALTFFHAYELCHHDFHPGNILLTDDKVLIGDLGLSSQANSTDLTVNGVFPYIPPE